MRILPPLVLLLALAAPVAAQSLVTAETLADGSLFADAVARQDGDLVTILIRETTSVRESQETETGRSNSGSIGGSFVRPNHTEADQIPALEFGTDTDFEGEAEYSQSGEIRATITGRVIDVLDNGNMVIEARRVLRVNDETKTIVLSGIVRRDDIGTGNTVLSERIHNFQVGIEGQGPLTRAQQRGWLGRLLDVLWPL